MRLLIITQKIDKDDDVLGFFHRWVFKIAPLVNELHVIANSVGSFDLPKNVKVYSLGKEKRYPRLYRYLIFYKHILSILPNVDGIFIHMCPEYVLALNPINIFFRKPIMMWYAHIKVGKIAEKALKKVKFILSPSRDSFAFKTSKVITTGHGIDVEFFSPSARVNEEKDTFEILSFSRISHVKSIETLIEATSILVHKYNIKNIHVKIIGAPARFEDHKYLADLKEKTEKLDVKNYITWEGSIPNTEAPRFYRMADIFVRMQKGGGFGKTELEAMASGTPAVLCTPVYKSLLSEFAEDLYFNEGDADDFARKLIAVMRWDKSHRQKYSKLARSIVVENHNLNNLAKKIINCFEKIR